MVVHNSTQVSELILSEDPTLNFLRSSFALHVGNEVLVKEAEGFWAAKGPQRDGGAFKFTSFALPTSLISTKQTA